MGPYEVLFVIAENEMVKNAPGGRVVFCHKRDSDRPLIARKSRGSVPARGS